MLIASILTGFLGTLIFLFLFWKKLKEDYSSDMVFKLGFGILTGILAGYFIALKVFPPAFLWLAFLGGMIGLIINILRLNFRFYEVFEAFIVSALPWLSLIFLSDSVVASSLNSFLAFLATLTIIFISYYFGASYKNFSWYKSGKVGFAGLATLGIIFLTRFILAIFKFSVISFVNTFEVYLSGVGVLVCIFFIINLGRIKK